MHLNSARALAQRVGFVDILQNQLKGVDSNDVSLEDIADAAFWANQLSILPAFSGSPVQVAADARNFRELEALVRALDTMETLASLRQLSKEYHYL